MAGMHRHRNGAKRQPRRPPCNGQLFDAGVTMDYGTAVRSLDAGQHDGAVRHAHQVLSRGWRTDTVDVVQGVYSDDGYSAGLSWNYGCMWFGRSARRALRQDGQVRDADPVPQDRQRLQRGQDALPVRHHQHHGQRRALHRGKLRGHRHHWPRAAGDVRHPLAAVQGLANGTYGGLCLYESPYNFGSANWSNNYMRMAGTDSTYKPYLQVVYNSGGTAVG